MVLRKLTISLRNFHRFDKTSNIPKWIALALTQLEIFLEEFQWFDKTSNIPQGMPLALPQLAIFLEEFQRCLHKQQYSLGNFNGFYKTSNIPIGISVALAQRAIFLNESHWFLHNWQYSWMISSTPLTKAVISHKENMFWQNLQYFCRNFNGFGTTRNIPKWVPVALTHLAIFLKKC